jgi:hypothetical protein
MGRRAPLEGSRTLLCIAEASPVSASVEGGGVDKETNSAGREEASLQKKQQREQKARERREQREQAEEEIEERKQIRQEEREERKREREKARAQQESSS